MIHNSQSFEAPSCVALREKKATDNNNLKTIIACQLVGSNVKLRLSS